MGGFSAFFGNCPQTSCQDEKAKVTIRTWHSSSEVTYVGAGASIGGYELDGYSTCSKSIRAKTLECQYELPGMLLACSQPPSKF